MVCSYGDYNDVQLFRQFGLKEVQAIDIEGKMTAVTGKYVAMAVKDARSQIIQAPPGLQDSGQGRAGAAPHAAVREEPHPHRDNPDGGVLPQAAPVRAHAEEAREADQVPPADAQADPTRLDELAHHGLSHLTAALLCHGDSDLVLREMWDAAPAKAREVLQAVEGTPPRSKSA